jgi:hypothetical protein
LLDEARANLVAVAPAALAQLPCDADHLGTLGHLARAACTLEAREYAEAVYALLSRYPDRYCVQISYLCEGAVPQLLGLLAHTLGDRRAAVAHFEAGIAMNERAGFAPRVAEAREQLARVQRSSTAAR